MRILQCSRIVLLTVLTLSVLLISAPLSAQMVAGKDIPGFSATFGLDTVAKPTFTAEYLRGTVKGNVLWPHEQGSFTFQVVNTGNAPLVAAGVVRLVRYGTKGRPGDIWVPDMYKIADCAVLPLPVNLAPNKWANYTVAPKVPETLGAYGLVLDLGPAGSRFITAFVRTFAADPTQVQFPKLGCDVTDPDVLERLGCKSIRYGVGFKRTTDKDYEASLANIGKDFAQYHAAHVTVIVEFGGGAFYDDSQPLGCPRPWLDDKGFMLDTKFDLAWLPKYDPDFHDQVRRVLRDYGWPKGPVVAVKLWNEPWNGISISGWGADDERFREITRVMGKAVQEARAQDGTQVLIGGTDSSSNTLDKFFADGSDEFYQYLDFCSIHYQGMAPPSTIKAWVNRQSPNGRVKIWDTESWVANTDDRVAAVMAANMSTGHDRAVGVYGGNICSDKHWYYNWIEAYGEDGKKTTVKRDCTWSVAASVGAAQHFLGERAFHTLLFQNGLPWVILFNGLPTPAGAANPEDGTVVVVGDLGEEFGANIMLFRTARGLQEIAHKAQLKTQLAALPTDSAHDVERAKMEAALAAPEVLSGATMTLKAQGSHFSLFDFYGNLVAAKGGKIVIPLDGRGFYLRGDGNAGSFALLTAALRNAKISGISPLAIQALDFTAPLTTHPTLRLRLTNVLNRPVIGVLRVKVGALTLDTPEQRLTLPGNTTQEVILRVQDGTPTADNTYPLSVAFTTKDSGIAVLNDRLHVNYIAKRSINIDGKLDDWDGILPQVIATNEKSAPTLAEYAWQPFKTFDTSVKKGFASAYLALDDTYFYFAAKIADATPDPGMLRYATRNDDDYFYPDTSYQKKDTKDTAISVRWTGTVTPKYTDTYTFSTVTDDGARLWVNGQQLVNDWNSHGDTENSGTIALEAGKAYPIILEYYDGGGGATTRLLWASARQAKEVIPTAALAPVAGAVGTGLTGTYFRGTNLSGDSVSRLDALIDFHLSRQNTPPALWTATTVTESYTWPTGVRHYSYRKDPELPAGNFPNHDNVQIAFNVLPADQKATYPCPPGTMPGYTTYTDTDYEYALNPVADSYGGGTEIWRLQYPGMPHKHFYPRQPKSPFDGPAPGGKLVITRDATTRIVECAIPWTELAEVKKAIDAGHTFKFSYRVNDNAGVGCMELSKNRSIAKLNGSFTVDWVEHWANELEFGVEK